LVKIVRFV